MLDIVTELKNKPTAGSLNIKCVRHANFPIIQSRDVRMHTENNSQKIVQRKRKAGNCTTMWHG
jgi:hypothetical protein